MKKILKIGRFLLSISSLAVLVFVGSVVSRFMGGDDTNKNGSNKLPLLLASALGGVDHARADVPGGGPSPAPTDCDAGPGPGGPCC